jgi:DNA-binding MarR family transcriptional regulator
MSSHNEIATKLHSGIVRLNKMIAIVDRDTDLSAARLSILASLTFGGAQTIGSLSKLEGVKPPTMTILVQALESEGLVKKEKSEEDARRAHVTVTPKGRKILEAARQARLSYLETLLKRLGRDELAALEAASKILLRMATFENLKEDSSE